MKKIMIGCLVLLVLLLYDAMRPIENSELEKEYIFGKKENNCYKLKR